MAEVNQAALNFAYEKGRKARRRGVAQEAGNPYASSLPYRLAWREGWQAEDRELQAREQILRRV